MQIKVTELAAKLASASSEKQFIALRNTYLLLKEDFKQMLTIVSSEVVPLTTFIIPSLEHATLSITCSCSTCRFTHGDQAKTSKVRPAMLEWHHSN